METTMTRKEITEAKAAIMEDKGCEKVRFLRGEIHCYGQMPNTNQTGWYFCGYVQDLEIKGLEGIGIHTG